MDHGALQNAGRTGAATGENRQCERERLKMGKTTDVTVIKKYANRRLYNTGTSTYVTLENLAAMVKGNEEFVVQDAKSGEDITHSVLTQIIFEQENKVGQNMMPIAFLRQLIRFYGDQMQMVIPSYLEQSMTAFAREQEGFREKGPGGSSSQNAIKLMETQVRRNTEMFRQAMSMFNPFMANAMMPGDVPGAPGAGAASAPPDDLNVMRRQLDEMQKRLEALDAKAGESVREG
jgi:polyhydroxyalkanoate synthesis repressor PhaR